MTGDREPLPARERLLEYSLEKHFGRHPDVDHAARIVAAWERGVTGPGVGELEGQIAASAVPGAHAAPGVGAHAAPGVGAPEAPGMRDGAAAAARARWSRIRVAALAASVLVLAAVGIALWRASSVAGPAARLAAVEEVTLLRGAERLRVRAAELAPGDAILAAASPLEVDLAGGERVRLGAGSVATVGAGGRALELLLGDLALETPAAVASAFSTGFATLHAEAGSTFEMRVEAYEKVLPDEPEARATAARGWLAAAPAFPRLLVVSISRGDARLSVAGADVALFAGEPVCVRSDPAAAEPLEEQLALGMLERVASVPGPGAGADYWSAFAKRRAVQRELIAFLALDPERWRFVRGPLDKLVADWRTPVDALQWLVATVAQEPSATAFELARELWLARPEAFAPDSIVALAERGGFEFERELEAMAEPGEEPARAILPAAYLAFRGDDRGRAHLEAAAREPLVAPGGLPLALVAAAALDGLAGEGRAAWDHVLEQLGNEVFGSLDDPRMLPMAAYLVQAATFVADLEASGELARHLAFVDVRAMDHADEAPLETPAAVLAAFEALRGRE